jgi:tetratricopeptide (TPR) repeat protein
VLVCAAPTAAQQDAPTFARDVAPLVHARCAGCHHAGGSAPFALVDYEDVAKRSAQIAAITHDRLMPPWLPARGENDFLDDRSLAPQEIELFARWRAAGSPAGDPRDLPPAPVFASGWQLGEPDLVLKIPAGYELAAEGRDVYRNFVISAARGGLSELRHVGAVEFRPANPRLCHHAVLFVDTTGSARELDAADDEPGYGGMGPGRARLPGGTFVSYAPGKAPHPPRPGISWPLGPDTDLVLQVHLRPTGKPESVRFALGLHFVPDPPTLHPLAIRLVSRDIDIPPGERDYVVEDEFVLPVAVDVLSVLPHAHYLGKDLAASALLPDGTRRTLIHVPGWDFNWQEEYRYRAPLSLPAGTRLALRYTYDNSADNPFNPSSPPRRVVHGPETTDEMAELVLEVLASDADRPLLQRAFQEKERTLDLAYVERMARAEPANPRWHNLAGSYALAAGRAAEAVEHYRRLVELRPGQANPLLFLGRAQLAQGKPEQAVRSLEAALALEERLVPARVELALAHAALGRGEAARGELETALALDSTNARVLVTLAELDLAAGERARARQRLEAALAADPEHRRAILLLSGLEIEAGELARAVALLQRALEAHPDDARLHHALALALEGQGDRPGARLHARAARALAPDDPELRATDERLAFPGG